MAGLSIEFTPGYEFADDELVTNDKLNSLAKPSVALNGSVGTATINDGSVTTAKLADGALSADATGRGKMADGFLTTSKIADANVTAAKLDEPTRGDAQQYAASGSSGGTTYAVTLSPAPTQYTTGQRVLFAADVANTGAATLNCNSLGAKNLLSRGGLALAASQIQANELVECVYDGTAFRCLGIPSRFVSAETTVGSVGQTLNAAHGLGVVPTSVRAVLRCKTGEFGFSVGDEVKLENILVETNTGPNVFAPVFSVTANATNVTVAEVNTGLGVWRKDTAAFQALTAGNWKLVVYAER